MIETIAVTTQADDKGVVTRLRAEVLSADSLAIHLDSAVKADEQYRRQVEIANSYLNRIASSLPDGLIDLARRNVHIRILPAEEIELTDSSHGLALLIAGVASVMGLRPLTDRAFSAALQPPQLANVISFDSVGGVATKARALGEEGVETLHYFRQTSWQDFEDRQVHDANLAYARGDGGCRCQAVVLPPTCSIFNLLNMAFDLTGLWPNLHRVAEGNLFGALKLSAKLLQAALWAPVIPDEFPYGVGGFFASLRSRGLVPPNLPEQLALETLVRKASDRHVPELIKTAISESAERSVAEDLEVWLNGDADSADLNPTDTPVGRMIWVLDVANLTDSLPPEAYSLARALLLQRVEESISDLVQVDSNLKRLKKLVESVCSIRSQFDGVTESAYRLLARVRLPQGHPGSAILAPCVESLARKTVTPVDLSTATRPMLTLVFQDSRLGSPEFTDGCEHPWPSIERLNPLEVRYEAPNDVRLAVPSPVLLLEKSQAQASYSRRSGFRLVDDTFSRLPWADARFIGGLFGAQPTRIDFHLVRPGDLPSEEVGIYWDPIRVPFPPAIDTQFLVAALQRWAHERSSDGPSIESIADIGCGTGLLALAASCLFPSVSTVHLVDVDDDIVLYAAENFRAWWNEHPRRNRSVSIQRFARGFDKWKPDQPLDLLICNPPYLPLLHASGAGIERATNGTDLLQAVTRRACLSSRYTWLVLSALAWREFELAIAPVLDRFESIIVFDRQFVPLRVNWIEPRLPDETNTRPEIAKTQYEQRMFYYEDVLTPRGLLDLDDSGWEQNVATRVANAAPALFAGTSGRVLLEDRSGLDASKLQTLLQELRKQSRGFRHWHETRVVLLVTKPR